jgi:hypothetical protein
MFPGRKRVAVERLLPHTTVTGEDPPRGARTCPGSIARFMVLSAMIKSRLGSQ